MGNKVYFIDQNTGNPVQIDFATKLSHGAYATLDYPHYEIHGGSFYSVFYKTAEGADLGDDASIAIGLTLGDKYIHFTAFGACGGDLGLHLYENPTLTDGTPITPRNHNREYEDASTVTVLSNPVIEGGTLLDEVYVPGGTGGQAVGESSGQREEWILKPNTAYVLVLTNRAGTAQPASLHVAWYEESEN